MIDLAHMSLFVESARASTYLYDILLIQVSLLEDMYFFNVDDEAEKWHAIQNTLQAAFFFWNFGFQRLRDPCAARFPDFCGAGF